MAVDLPNAPTVGDIITAGTNGAFYRWDGVKWALAGPPPSTVQSFNGRTGIVTLAQGDVALALGYTAYNAANPAGYVTQTVGDTRYMQQATADGRYLQLSGVAPMTGPLLLAGDPTLPLGAVTMQFVQARGVGNRLLYQTSTLAGNGADTTQDVMQTFSVPANTLVNVGDRLIVRAGGTFVGSTDAKTVAIRWGGGNVGALGAAVVGQQAWKAEAEIMKTGASAQTMSSFYVSNSNATFTTTTTATRTDTAAVAIDITGQNATTATASSVTCRYFTVDYVAAA